jgi:hypothetical protein
MYRSDVRQLLPNNTVLLRTDWGDPIRFPTDCTGCRPRDCRSASGLMNSPAAFRHQCWTGVNLSKTRAVRGARGKLFPAFQPVITITIQ